MNRHPHDGEEPSSWERRLDRGIVSIPPVPQLGFTVSFREWSRIKKSAKGIRSNESQWLSGVYALSSAAIAFLIGAVSLWHLENANSWIFTAFCVLAGIGFGFACGCGIAYWGRGQRQSDIKSVIGYMNDIEANYTNDQSEQPPEQPRTQ